MNLWRSTLLFTLALASCLPTFADAAKQRGRAVFVSNGCQHCHTIHDQGGERGPDLSGVGRTLNKTQIRSQITQGGRQMPSFGDILKASEVDDLVAYLHSCRDKKPK